MTTLKDFEERHPLRGEAKRECDQLRREIGVGYLILKARASAELTQAQLAKKIGTSQPMVARWESGAQIPSVRTLMKIAQATGFDLAVGLHAPGTASGELVALSVVEGQPARKRRVVAARRSAPPRKGAGTRRRPSGSPRGPVAARRATGA